MRIFPIAIALGLTLAGPALVASESTKMKGQDQNAKKPPLSISGRCSDRRLACREGE
jgi:hypothetical protein